MGLKLVLKSILQLNKMAAPTEECRELPKLVAIEMLGQSGYIEAEASKRGAFCVTRGPTENSLRQRHCEECEPKISCFPDSRRSEYIWGEEVDGY